MATFGSILYKSLIGPIQIGKAFGIPVRMDMGFPMFLMGLTALYVFQYGLLGGVGFLVLMGVIFGSVLLHEFGHALAARHCGLSTREIILMPLGGLAYVEPTREPKHELFIVLMGPLVNMVLATLFLFLSVMTGSEGFQSDFYYMAYYFNWLLFAFNLFIPAFPMDGGRVLRSSMALFMDYRKATLIASWFGRIGGLAMIVYGFWTFPNMFPLLGFFIFIAAWAEYRALLDGTLDTIKEGFKKKQGIQGFSRDSVLKARNVLAAMMWVMREAEKIGVDQQCTDYASLTDGFKSLDILISGDEKAYLCCLLGHANRLHDAIRVHSFGTTITGNGLRSALRVLRLAMADLDSDYDWTSEGGRPEDLEKQIELNRIVIDGRRADIWQAKEQP